jgi:hypothetical protein
MRSLARGATAVLLSLFVLLPLLPVSAIRAQEPSSLSSCHSNVYGASTDRPTYSNATATTPCGVVEVTGGPERQWIGHGLHQDDFAEGVQFGLTPRADVHYWASGYFEARKNAGAFSGMGDRFFGVRYRISGPARCLPSTGIFYTVKVPTGSPAAGMGSGRFDHMVALLASQDVTKRLHLDFNLTPQWIGDAATPKWDRNVAIVLFASIPVTGKLTFVGGSYGFTRLNAASPGYAVASVGLDWQVCHRLIFDVSFDEGLTSAAPRRRMGAGFTYAPANLYALIARRPQIRH